jgi:hypothetical protein
MKQEEIYRQKSENTQKLAAPNTFDEDTLNRMQSAPVDKIPGFPKNKKDNDSEPSPTIGKSPSPHRGSQASQTSFLIKRVVTDKQLSHSPNSPDIHNLQDKFSQHGS